MTPLHQEITSTASSQRWERWVFLCVCIVFVILAFYNEICQLKMSFVFTDRRRTKILVFISRICVFALWTCLVLEQKLLPLLYTGECFTWSTTLTYKVCVSNICPTSCLHVHASWPDFIVSGVSHRPVLYWESEFVGCVAHNSPFNRLRSTQTHIVPVFTVCRESPGWDRYCHWFIQTALFDW